MSNYVYKVRRKAGTLDLEVNGVFVHHLPGDFELFKEWCPPVEGKTILMGGLGFGVDALWCVLQGATRVVVVELIPEVIELFKKDNKGKGLEKITLLEGDFYSYLLDLEPYDLVIDSIGKYELIKGEERCLQTIR